VDEILSQANIILATNTGAADKKLQSTWITHLKARCAPLTGESMLRRAAHVRCCGNRRSSAGRGSLLLDPHFKGQEAHPRWRYVRPASYYTLEHGRLTIGL
jgi:hypothetical protein